MYGVAEMADNLDFSLSSCYNQHFQVCRTALLPPPALLKEIILVQQV